MWITFWSTTLFDVQASPGIIANPFAAGIVRKNSMESISSIDRDLSPEEIDIMQKVEDETPTMITFKLGGIRWWLILCIVWTQWPRKSAKPMNCRELRWYVWQQVQHTQFSHIPGIGLAILLSSPRENHVFVQQFNTANTASTAVWCQQVEFPTTVSFDSCQAHISHMPITTRAPESTSTVVFSFNLDELLEEHPC